jgi:hypothetical protein
VSDKPLPKAEWVVDHIADLLNQRASSKTKLPYETEKQIVNCNVAWTVERVGGTLNLPQKNRAGQGAKLPALSCQ